MVVFAVRAVSESWGCERAAVREVEMSFWNPPRTLERLQHLPDESLCREVAAGNQEAYLVLFER